MNVLDSIIFQAADALGVDLFEVGPRLQGILVKDVKIGPWKVAFDLWVVSDVLNEKLASLLVRVKGGVWMYLISEQDRLTLTVFDGGALGLRPKDATAFATGDVVKTLKKIMPQQRGQFVRQGDHWVELPVKE